MRRRVYNSLDLSLSLSLQTYSVQVSKRLLFHFTMIITMAPYVLYDLQYLQLK